MVRVLQSISNIFFSLLLGVIALAICAIYAPGIVNFILDQSGYLKVSIIDGLRYVGVEESLNVLIRYILKDEQFVLMAFVIAMRIVLALIMWGVNSAFGIGEEA